MSAKKKQVRLQKAAAKKQGEEGVTHIERKEEICAEEIELPDTLTEGVVEFLYYYYTHCRSVGVTAFYLSAPTSYSHSHDTDWGWGCGYRNVQMGISSLLRLEPYARVLRRHCIHHVPALSEIQDFIEQAWLLGFDAKGSAKFGRKLKGTKKPIGATEVTVLYRMLHLEAKLVEFTKPTATHGTHQLLFSWIKTYFRTGRAPARDLDVVDSPELSAPRTKARPVTVKLSEQENLTNTLDVTNSSSLAVPGARAVTVRVADTEQENSTHTLDVTNSPDLVNSGTKIRPMGVKDSGEDNPTCDLDLMDSPDLAASGRKARPMRVRISEQDNLTRDLGVTDSLKVGSPETKAKVMRVRDSGQENITCDLDAMDSPEITTSGAETECVIVKVSGQENLNHNLDITDSLKHSISSARAKPTKVKTSRQEDPIAMKRTSVKLIGTTEDSDFPPLFLQYQGQSWTVIGLEEHGAYGPALLMLDPNFTPEQLMSVMRLPARDVNLLKKPMHRLRAPKYHIVYVEWITLGAKYEERLKEISPVQCYL